MVKCTHSVSGLRTATPSPRCTVLALFLWLQPAAARSKNKTAAPLQNPNTKGTNAKRPSPVTFYTLAVRQPSHNRSSEAVSWVRGAWVQGFGRRLSRQRARVGMESLSSGGELARRQSSGGGSSGWGSFSGDADPFDIPAKGAPLERLRKWRVSTLLHARHL
jgi:hypothetical protein